MFYTQTETFLTWATYQYSMSVSSQGLNGFSVFKKDLVYTMKMDPNIPGKMS